MPQLTTLATNYGSGQHCQHRGAACRRERLPFTLPASEVRILAGCALEIGHGYEFPRWLRHFLRLALSTRCSESVSSRAWEPINVGILRRARSPASQDRQVYRRIFAWGGTPGRSPAAKRTKQHRIGFLSVQARSARPLACAERKAPSGLPRSNELLIQPPERIWISPLIPCSI